MDLHVSEEIQGVPIIHDPLRCGVAAQNELEMNWIKFAHRLQRLFPRAGRRSQQFDCPASPSLTVVKEIAQDQKL